MKFLTTFIFTTALLFNVPLLVAQEPGEDPGATTGTVAETLESGGYTYLRMEDPDIWIATASMPVSVGDQVYYGGGMEMRDFYSRSMDRTFGSIFFIQNVSLAGQSAEQLDIDAMHAAAMEGYAADHNKVTIPKPVTVASPGAGEITALTNGKTIAGIYAESGQLNEQPVSINARVIKVSAGIMGKNWITLQDGTGVEPDNKLLATSEELVAAGDMVIARGIVRTDIDIGSGYRYKVLLEKATFSAGFE